MAIYGNNTFGVPYTPQSIVEILEILNNLTAKHWCARGQSNCHEELFPSIDRKSLKNLPRDKKLELEQQSIYKIRQYATKPENNEKTVLHQDESNRYPSYDLETLMLLQHYLVPSRLLDWSFDPFIGAYFCVCENHWRNGDIWSFDWDEFQKKCVQKWPEIKYIGTRIYDDTFQDRLNEAFFCKTNPENWIMPGYYIDKTTIFPRMNAQWGFFTIMGQFGQDHAVFIRKILGDTKYCRRYIIRAKFKQELRIYLQEEKKISRRTMYPDTGGAAETVVKEIFPS